MMISIAPGHIAANTPSGRPVSAARDRLRLFDDNGHQDLAVRGDFPGLAFSTGPFRLRPSIASRRRWAQLTTA
jgi:hypothetical protein